MKNEQFEKDIEFVRELFPSLFIISENGEKFLKGELNIIDNYGKLWETYLIEIKASQDYPIMFPKLFELGNAFPKIADWHVYEKDASCCVDITPNEILICKNGLHITEYIKRFAVPYFANQKFRELEGYYLYGEYSHGIFGRIEFYQSKLKAKTPKELIQMFNLILRGFNHSRTAYCPFCNKIKFRKCHRDAFRELEAIKPFLYYDGIEQLIPFFEANPNYKLPKV
jgi:hypothetical protein